MYVLVKDGSVVSSPYSMAQLRADNPQTSFPETPSDAVLAEFDVFPCVETEKPQISHLQNIAKSFGKVNGVWTQGWTVSDASAAEIADRVAAQCESVREERNGLLAACDWTQLPDAPVSQSAWFLYRQQLRDLTIQEGFPWNVTWPTEP